MKEAIKGKGAVGVAISYYSLRGIVSIPLEPCAYNLLYDDHMNIYKIKVISCSYKTPYGIYSASIRTMGGNMPHMKVKEFDPMSCDYVFIVTDKLDLFSIPAREIQSKRQISLNAYEKFKVALGL
jgi:hypothetical protein